MDSNRKGRPLSDILVCYVDLEKLCTPPSEDRLSGVGPKDIVLGKGLLAMRSVRPSIEFTVPVIHITLARYCTKNDNKM